MLTTSERETDATEALDSEANHFSCDTEDWEALATEARETLASEETEARLTLATERAVGWVTR